MKKKKDKKERWPRVKLPPTLDNMRPIDFRYVDKEYFTRKMCELGIKTARQYWKWWEKFKPAGFPWRPDRTYDASWNELLKVDNVYNPEKKHAVKRHELIPYWDAVNLVQKLNIKTSEEYRERFDRGEIPKGIPKYPDRRYRDFYTNGGWYTFLGKNIQGKLEAQKHLLEILVLYYASQFNSNIIGIYVHKGTFVDLQKWIKENQINVIQMYNIENNDDRINAFNIINNLCNQQSDNTWIVGNLHGLLWELNNVLEIFKKPE